MKTIKRGETTLYYEVHGPASAECTLVLLHGVGGNHASWFHQVTAWRERFRLVVPDARGFGKSNDAEGAGRDGFLQDLECVLDAENVQRCVLIGQSMGGGTAIDYACEHPDRTMALVLADTLFGISLPSAQQEEMAEVSRRTATYSQQERVLGSTFRRRQPAESTLYTALASFNQVNVRTLQGKQVEHLLEEISATAVPVLFVVGEEDLLFPPAIVRKVHDGVTGARFIELPKVGHSAYFEAPEAFNRVIEYWLEGVTGGATAPQAPA